MGQQQLLLVCLSVIIIGTAIYAGFRVAEMQNQNQSRDQLISHINVLNSQLQVYLQKPKSFNGGGGSAVGFKLPKALLKTPAGTFTYTRSGQNVTFTGTGTVKGNNAKTSVRVTGRVAKNKLTITTNN